MTELGLTLLIINKHLRFIEPWILNQPSYYASGHAQVLGKNFGSPKLQYVLLARCRS